MRSIKLPSIKLIYFFFVFLLAALSFLLFKRIDSLSKSADLVNRTNAVHVQLEETISLLQEIESNQRGFLLTKDSVYLKERYDAFKKLHVSLAQLKSGLADDPFHQRHVDTLSMLINQRSEILNRVLWLYEHDPQLEGAIKKEMVSGLSAMKAVRSYASQLMWHQHDIQRRRLNNYKEYAFVTPFYALLFTFFVIVFIAVAYMGLRRQLVVSQQHAQETKVANSQLRVTNTIYEMAEGNAGIGSWSWNLDTNEFTASKNLYKIFGYEPMEFEPSPLGFLKHAYPEDKDKMRMQIREDAFEQHRIQTVNYRIVDKNGRIVHVQGKRKFFRNEQGERVVLGTTQDISMLVRVINRLSRVIDQLKRSEGKLDTLNRDLIARNLALQQANEELASFNYVASHDLQEPLRKIQTFTSFLVEKEDHISDAGQIYLEKMQYAAKRMRLLIKDLLSYSYTDIVDKSPEPVDLNKVLQNTLAVLKVAIDEKKAVIHASRLPVIKGIEFQMLQLFENIIGNALKYSKAGQVPNIFISGEKVQHAHSKDQQGEVPWYYKISIADNGIGFEQEYAGKIFDLFQRLHGKSEYEGTGIGLAISKKIVQCHGGMIEAFGIPGIGATFTIYFPVEALIEANSS